MQVFKSVKHDLVVTVPTALPKNAGSSRKKAAAAPPSAPSRAINRAGEKKGPAAVSDANICMYGNVRVCLCICSSGKKSNAAPSCAPSRAINRAGTRRGECCGYVCVHECACAYAEAPVAHW